MSRYSKNCAGDFFVEEGECILCTLPESEAPMLMASDDYSCYFVRQPRSNQEIEAAITAMAVSCCSAVKYGGKNKEIIKKILSEPYADTSCITQLSAIDAIKT